MSLVISNLDLFYGRSHILHGIDLEVRSGEMFSLLGKSGSGKSTLLKVIAGLAQESNGAIMLDGRPLHELPPQERRAAVVFQDLRLFPHMKVGENVAYPLRVKGVSKRARLKRANELLELVHLEGFADRHVHQLSGGQAQRVAIARALAAEPQILLLDEPFSALDENLRESMRSFVSDIHRRCNLTTIMVTHNQHEALSMSDRIAVMSEGRIMQVGTPREIYHDPANLEIALYLSDASLLHGVVEGGIFRASELEIACGVPDGSYKALVRSSAVSVEEGGQDMVVEDVRYQGDALELVLKRKQAVVRMIASENMGVSRGDVVGVAFDGDEVLYFED